MEYHEIVQIRSKTHFITFNLYANFLNSFLMIRKSVLIFSFLILLIGCGDDLEQGACEEGFVEAAAPDGTSTCIPISEVEAID